MTFTIKGQTKAAAAFEGNFGVYAVATSTGYAGRGRLPVLAVDVAIP